jgi:hypothetical protein
MHSTVAFDARYWKLHKFQIWWTIHIQQLCIFIFQIKVQKYCAKTLSVDSYCAHWTVSSHKIIKKTNSDHQIQQSHWHEKKIFKLTQTPIFLNIENNGLFLLDFHWSFKILTDLAKLIIHLTITSLKIIEKKIQTTKSNNFVAHNIFSLHLQPSLFNTLYILINWYLYPYLCTDG